MVDKDKKVKKEGNPSGGIIKASSPSVKEDIGFLKTTSKQSGGRTSSKYKGAKKGHIPKGMTKTAGYVSGPSTSRMPSMYYHPLYEETNIQLPREPREINQWARHFYKCLTPNSNITMGNATLKLLSEVKIGDEVITHSGRVGKVNEIFDRVIIDDLYHVYIKGHKDSLDATKQHPFFILKQEEANCPKYKTGTLCKLGQWEVCKGCTKLDLGEPDFVEARDLRIGDYVLTPIIKQESSVDFSKEFVRLLGYFVAEGSFLYKENKKEGKYPSCIRFTIHSEERNTLGKEINELCVNISGKECEIYPDMREGKQVLEYRLYDRFLAKRFYKLCGSGATTKCLHKDILFMNLELQKEFLGAYINGDGYQISESESNQNNGQIVCITSSPYLAEQLIHIFRRCGVIVKKYKQKTAAVVGGEQFESYQVVLPPKYANMMTDYTFYESVNKDRYIDHHFIWNGWVISKITNIEVTKYHGRIMNLNIEGSDNSFIANDMAVHNTDPIVATGLDFHSQFPITSFYNEMPESDTYIEKYFNELAFDILKLKYVMLYISHEYWVLGNAFPFAEWDENEGRWNRIILLNPDYVSITGSALAGDPKIELMADQRIQNIVNTRQPKDVFESLPKELVARVSRGEKIPLHPDHVTHIAHKLNYYDEYGTPIMYRLFKILMYKDRLREAQFAIAERHITPLQIWKLGEKGNEANEDDIEYFKQILDQVYADRNAAIVYGHYLDYSVVGSSGQIVPLNTEFEYIEKEILFGLGLSANIITGEGQAFTQPLIALESLINRYLLFREMLSNYIQDKIYKPIAEAQGFVKQDKASGREYLLYPRVRWSKMNLRDDIQQKNALLQLRQQKNLSMKTTLDLFGLSYETEKKNLEEEMMTIFNLQVQALKAQEALKPILPNIPPMMDRQKARQEMGAKWKDYLELTVDGALLEKIESGEINREDADKVRQDIIKEVTLGQSISILKQIEDNIMSELNKSMVSGDVTKEDAENIKFDIMRGVAKEYQIPGFGILTEIIEQASKNVNAQVEAGVLNYDEAEKVKGKVIQELALEEIDRIVEAALNNYKIIKIAGERAMKARADMKVGKFLKLAKNKKSTSIEDVVDEASEEIKNKNKEDGEQNYD